MLREEQRLENLVNGLLQATTMDAGRVAVDPEEVDWRSLVADQVDLYRRNDPDRTVIVVIEPGLDRVVVDPDAGQRGPRQPPFERAQVLTGRLPDRGAVGDRGRPRSSRRSATAARACPSATGERIFEKFTRLGDHLTRPQQGIGLGLYIARQAVEQMERRPVVRRRAPAAAPASASASRIDGPAEPALAAQPAERVRAGCAPEGPPPGPHCSVIVTFVILTVSFGRPSPSGEPAMIAWRTSRPSVTRPNSM